MSFHVGDKVVHRSFGPGVVTGLEEKKLAGETRLYYVVEVNKLTIWVPVDHALGPTLRPSTPRREFKKIYTILRSPGEMLAEDRFQRQTELAERMREGTVESLCRVVRDLNSRASVKKLNENDNAVLRRALGLLLDEWQVSQGNSLEEARHELDQLLGESLSAGASPAML